VRRGKREEGRGERGEMKSSSPEPTAMGDAASGAVAVGSGLNDRIAFLKVITQAEQGDLSLEQSP
jgi:hypothetical protein